MNQMGQFQKPDKYTGPPRKRTLCCGMVDDEAQLKFIAGAGWVHVEPDGCSRALTPTRVRSHPTLRGADPNPDDHDRIVRQTSNRRTTRGNPP